MSNLTAKKLRDALDYNPRTGEFRWREGHKGRGCMAGYLAGTVAMKRGKPYRQICLFYKSYFAHRLAFLWMTGKWPLKETDHINCDGLDNRWANLRLATNQQNQANSQSRMKKIKNTPKGVTWDKRSQKYKASIKVNYKLINIGDFDTPEQASVAYATAAKKYFGEYARS